MRKRLLAEKRMGLAVAAAMMATVVSAGPVGSIFNPNDYAAAAALTLSSGHDLDINTQDGTVTPVLTYDTGAGPQTVNGHIVTNQSGKIVMALFCFESLDIGSGVDNAGQSDGVVTVIGNLGVVLASRGNLTFDAKLCVAGTAGVGGTDGVTGAAANWSDADVGRGGPGADGRQTDQDGNRGTGESNPPGLRGGDGGWVQNSSSGPEADGRGWGGGLTELRWGWDSWASGSGGGYGGAGAAAVQHYAPNTTAGGVKYGDDFLENLYGGSGGGGAHANKNQPDNATGGGGGGSVALIARSILDFGGTIDASGGGGAQGAIGGYVALGAGGSGGGVLLVGAGIVFDSGAKIDASGGDPVDATSKGNTYACGGGGGRVAIYSGNIWSQSAVADLESFKGDNDNDGLGGDLAGKAFGMDFKASEGAVDVRRGIRSGEREGANGTFYVLYALPPKGTVFILR
jgi:hypothetical protein